MQGKDKQEDKNERRRDEDEDEVKDVILQHGRRRAGFGSCGGH